MPGEVTVIPTGRRVKARESSGSLPEGLAQNPLVLLPLESQVGGLPLRLLLSPEVEEEEALLAQITFWHRLRVARPVT